MMTLQSNKQAMKYSLQGGRVPIYETDENGNIVYYTDSDGNQIPMETGEYTTGYSQPVSFFGNIAMSGGEVDFVEMYNAYHALGGNGMVTKMYNEIQALHLQKKDGGHSHE